jgi:hypothetical protein
MTKTYRPTYLIEELGELGRLPDGAIVNIGGTSNATFTVGGRALLFADGSSTAGNVGSFTLQVAYGNSSVPAQINLTTGKNFVLNALDSNQFIFDAAHGGVTITGTLNGIPVADIIAHLNAATSPAKHAATQISANTVGLTHVSGSNVQQVIESIDSSLATVGSGNVIGYEYLQPSPSMFWIIHHNKNSTKVQWSVYDETAQAILPDHVAITDSDTVTVIFTSPQAGRAILMIF